jgi:hypothetical protein
MVIGRIIGIALVLLSLLCGVGILYGAAVGDYAAGLIRTWVALGATGLVGVALASFCSSLSRSDSLVKGLGGAYLGLGVVSGSLLGLSKAGTVALSDTMQPWVLLLVCIVVGGILVFGSRA